MPADRNWYRTLSSISHLALRRVAARGLRPVLVSRAGLSGLSLSAGEAVLVHHAKVRLHDGDWLSEIASMGDSEQSVSSKVRLSWVGANPHARAEASEPQRGTSNYFLGNDSKKWRTNVSHYGKIRFASIYKGIDLIYHGNQDRVEMDYVVAPQADPGTIRMAIDGPSIVAIEPNGDLSISEQGDEVLLRAPVAYQEIRGERRAVNARFVLESSHTVGFTLGDYDHAKPLTIDPVLDYAASFGGGRRHHHATSLTDSQGNIYLAGRPVRSAIP